MASTTVTAAAAAPSAAARPHPVGQPEGEGQDGEGALLAAVIDNRAGEVGLAVLDAGGGRLLLAQHIDTTRSFAHTLSLLELYSPARLLVVAEAHGAGVARATAQQFAQVPVPRGAWDDSQGYVALCQYATPEARAALEGGMLQAARNGYLAHAAAGALLRFLELGDSGAGLVLARGSLAMQQVGSATHMAIDAGTAAALELTHPLRVGTCSTTGQLSLFKVLDRTKTRCGARLLRASLLQPLRDIPTLNARYDAVQELAQDVDMAGAVAACLARLPQDMDRMCGALSLRPAKSDATMLRRIAAMIQSFILLREALAALPPLAEALAGARCEVLRAVRDAAGHAAFAELARELVAVLEDDVASSRNAFLNRTQQCFAVKKGCDGFLDVARGTFCRVTEQVHELAEQLRSQHSLPDLRVCYTVKRGFYLQVGAGGGRGGGRGGRGKHPREMMEEPEPGSMEEEEGGQLEAAEQSSVLQGSGGRRGRGGAGTSAPRLPPGFSVLQRTARGVQATTAELGALNSRLRDSSNDCLVLTEQVLEGLAARVVAAYLPLLHRLVDSLALLDMLAGFAAVTSCSDGGGGAGRQYVRPVLTQGGPLALVEARHPLLECLEEGPPFQPNDTFLALNASLHIITGPNMSGKSTFLRQVALCVVAAQAGAFVPAAFASIPPVDRLLARLGTGDSLETNSSSFAVEMQEVAHILAAATPRSLVLIDELGRATSTADGAGIAWAVAEALLARGAPTLFATHFERLTELAAVYPAAKALSFDLGDVAGRRALDFTWRLRPGASEAGHYGLLLAAAVGFPPDVLAAAEEVVQALDAGEGRRALAYATAEAEELEAVFGVVQKLACVAQSFGSAAEYGQQEARSLQRTLRRLKAEAAAALAGGETAALPG